MNEQDNGLVKDEETGLMLDKETGIYYEEKEDGMYYPLIERKEYWIGKYGDMAMNYMKETQPDRYIKLTIEDKLLELMSRVNEEAYERKDVLMKQLLEEHPLSDPGSTMTSYQERLQLEMIAEEIILNEIVYQPR